MVKRAQTSKTETETKTEAKTKMSRLAETGILASRSKSRAHFWLKDGRSPNVWSQDRDKTRPPAWLRDQSDVETTTSLSVYRAVDGRQRRTCSDLAAQKHAEVVLVRRRRLAVDNRRVCTSSTPVVASPAPLITVTQHALLVELRRFS